MSIKLIDKVITEITTNESLEFYKEPFSKYKVVNVHRRRLSSVYQISIDFSKIGNKNFHVKIIKCASNNSRVLEKYKDRLIYEYNSHEMSFSRFSNSEQFKVVKPICILPELLVLVTESFPQSLSLEQILTKDLFFATEQKLKELERHMFMSGSLLRKYHHLKIQNGLTKNTDSMTDYILVRLNLIYEFFAKELTGYRITKNKEDFKREFEAITDALSEEMKSTVVCHGDFTPSNILYDGKSFTLIDFSEVAESPRYLDMGCFLNYLDMLSLNKPIRFQESKINNLKDSFLKGYTEKDKLNINLRNLYQLRYFSTNMLTQIKEMQNSNLKNWLLQKRIKRYMKALGNYRLT